MPTTGDNKNDEMEEGQIQKLLKSRAGARSWVTRAGRAIQALCAEIGHYSVSDLQLVKLRDAIDVFDKRVASLEVVQSEVEMSIHQDELETDINDAFVFLVNMKEARMEAEVLLSKHDKNVHSDACSVHSDHSHSPYVGGVKLPKLELPKFDGTITDWQTFWDKFVALVDQSSLPVISKFSYLQSLVTGEAKAVIQGLAVTEKNYNVACQLLKDRYGRQERIVFAHIQALLTLTVPVRGKQVSTLWKLQDELLGHIRSLEALGIDGQQYGVFLTPVILSRLPHDMRMEWARDGEGKETDLAWLLDL
jgi:hypothetical protein